LTTAYCIPSCKECGGAGHAWFPAMCQRIHAHAVKAVHVRRARMRGQARINLAYQST